MTPTILFVPGYWEGPATFEHVISLLVSQGYPTEITELVSTGTTSPGNPSMLDDIAAIRLEVQKLVQEEEKDVILVVHSIAGMLGPSAIEGLGSKVRSDAGLKGGVRKIVFLAAAAAPEGFTHGPMPFFEYDGGAIYCKTPAKLLFNDLDAVATERWMKVLKSQPAAGWDDTVTYCGWKEVPSVYLVCEKDAILPETMQLGFAQLAGSQITRCAAGHMVQISMPEKVAEVVKAAAEDPEN
ncbi:hypothetical protein LOCC1_G003961 [Lachnellula occidentalis]|uniref:AB hydrolase-1 domain-containing protein n=1 Tax=Lachnellula occidentalis TaxID=215460 RepID=A0A8H8S5L7_9HELO|nr:hypothetical protein LOCC1_G003961 [Lachnellula occidentalis]